MKRTTLVKRLILAIGLILLISNSLFSQEKKNVELKIKTSAVCSQCKDRIEQGMAFEKGVKDVVLDVANKIVTIQYNPAKTSPARLRVAISKLGYDADSLPANKEAYAKLPPCCKKK